jgi:hypothetical protein
VVALQLLLIVSAAFGAVVLGAAEIEFRRDLPYTVRLAASLGNSRYDERLAELEPEHGRDVLREALLADPRASSLWISLGLMEERATEENSREKRLLEKALAERNRPAHRITEKPVPEDVFGDFRAARFAFESAFRLDQQYAPAWALANFCVRRGDQDCFWRAASRALARAPVWAAASAESFPNLTDLRPLLDLASRMEPSPVGVLDRLESGVAGEARPPDPISSLRATLWTSPNAPYATAASVAAPLERAYLDDLIGKSQWEEGETVARRIASELTRTELAGAEGARRGVPDYVCQETPRAASLDASDTARMDDFVTRLIGVGRAPAAVRMWNEYAGFRALDPSRGLSLTNGDFRREPRNTAFDWRLRSESAASERPRRVFDGIEPLWTPSQLEFRFSGDEPEQSQLAEQWLPLVQQSYRFTFEYQTRAMPSPSGIRWEIAAGQPLANAPSLEPSTGWQTAQWNFRGVEGATPLRLVYRRAPGTMRARGSFFLRRVRLDFL